MRREITIQGMEITESEYMKVCSLINECEPGEVVVVAFPNGLPPQKDIDFLVMGALYGRGRLITPHIDDVTLTLTVE